MTPDPWCGLVRLSSTLTETHHEVPAGRAVGRGDQRAVRLLLAGHGWVMGPSWLDHTRRLAVVVDVALRFHDVGNAGDLRGRRS